jgi:surfeit locus 1 family protein
MTTIRFRFFRLHFESGAGFVLLVAAVLALMIGAGFWQLDRARQKTAMLQAFENAMDIDVFTVLQGLPSPEIIRYRQLRIMGSYLADRQLLLDNRMLTDEHGTRRVGYEVLTPFRMNDGAVLLVNRGWVAGGDDRRVLPDVGVDTRERGIIGIVDMPQKSFSLGEIDADMSWPRVIQYIDYAALAGRLEISNLYPAILMLAPEDESGFQRNWQPVIEGPLKHYSYAAQWFLMSLATVILFLVFARRNKHDK